MSRQVEKSLKEWAEQLSPQQFRVLREKGTERPFSGQFDQHDADGVYVCAGCGETLFDSGHKFDAGCGWPSFSAPVSGAGVEEESDTTLGMSRTEVLCEKCGGHLGHVFPDGPQPTGLRYCINSASLEFKAREDVAS